MPPSRNRTFNISRPFAIWMVGIALFLGPFIVVSILKVDTSSSDVKPWFPDNTSERVQLQQFEGIFGPQDFWLISSEAGEAGVVLKSLANKIREIDRTAPEPRLLDAIIAPGDFLAGKSETEATKLKESLAGIFFSHDGEREALFLRSSHAGFDDRVAVFERITKAIVLLDLDPGTLHFTGPGYLGVMADKETRETLKVVTPVTFILSALFALILMRNLKTAGIALFASGVAAGLPVAAIYFSGNSMSHLLVVVPSLAQLLALSNAVHLIHYYKDAVAMNREGSESAATIALRHGFKPTVAACLTTALGFLALQSSSLPVVRSFSFFGTFSVIGAMITVLALVPACLFLLKPSVPQNDPVEVRWMPALDRIVAKFGSPLAFGLLGLLLASFWGVTRLKTEVRMETFFPEHSDFTKNYRWFNDQFGEVQTTEVFAAFDPDISEINQLQQVEELVSEMESGEDGLKTFSIASILPMDPSLLEPAPPETMKALMEKAHDLNFTSEHDGKRFWKITVFDQPYPDISSSLTVRKIETSFKRVGDRFEAPEVPWAITGSYQLFGSAQETLLKELLQTFFLAFILITPCIVLFLHNVSLGLVAMIGNMFPIAIFFGAMGFLGIRIDIATMVIASIAFGIAIDDTVHFLARLCEPSQGRDPVSFAFEKAGAAIFKTTVIISIGMLAFLLSDFDPSRRFAICTSIVLVLAMVGDLILLPALIRGPLLRWFPR